MRENDGQRPKVSDEMAKAVTTIMCTLIAALVSWQAYSTYQTSIAVVEIRKDFAYMERRVNEMQQTISTIKR